MRVLVAVVEMGEKEANAIAAAALPLFVIDIYRLSRSPYPLAAPPTTPPLLITHED